jgi:hypothetical protein
MVNLFPRHAAGSSDWKAGEFRRGKNGLVFPVHNRSGNGCPIGIDNGGGRNGDA